MVIKKIINGKWLENCYIISSNKIAIIIDPGSCYDQICNYLYENELKLKAIINTHAHFDHIVSVADLVQEFKCPFYLHSMDERLLKSANLYTNIFEGENNIMIPTISHYLDNINSLSILDDIDIKIFHTPGHTNGSVCFGIENLLFTGDTLLKNKIGRYDLPGANKLKFKNSLKIISQLNPSYVLYPGHGEATTLFSELSFNKPFIEFIS